MMFIRLLLAVALAVAASSTGFAAEKAIVLASTTSVEASGLLAHILPQFTAKTGITVNVVAQGTGKAIDTARRGDADLLLVHDPEAEQHFMDEGHGAAELRLWKAGGFTPDTLNAEKWYRDIGGGMGQALNAASAMNAYTLSDRGTWLSFNNKGSLVISVEGDSRLINRYDVIELNPQKHSSAKLDDAKVFADWLVSSKGQQAIGAYQVNGEKLFNPSADSPK
jgi:tungstate transport system substrate-binding protein